MHHTHFYKIYNIGLILTTQNVTTAILNPRQICHPYQARGCEEKTREQASRQAGRHTNMPLREN